MKFIKSKFLVFFFVLVLLTSAFSLNDAYADAVVDNWTDAPTTNVGSTHMYGVSMGDSSNGVAVGESGQIVFTNNGGVTWTLAPTTNVGTTDMYGVSMSDASNGVAVGASGQIVFTTNGGVTWTDATTTNVDSTVMWAVSMSDASNGVAVGKSGTIVFTTNGGVVWTAATTNTDDPATEEQEENDTIVMKGVSMSDASNGVAVGKGGKIIFTTNGGVDWTDATTTNVASTRMYGVSMSDVSNGVAVGRSGQIVYTNNGGVDWTDATTTNVASTIMNGVSMSDASNGVAVGQSGEIVYTTNGGVDWTDAPTTNVSTTDMYGVSMSDASNGVVVGKSGEIVYVRTVSTFSPLTFPPHIHDEVTVTINSDEEFNLNLKDKEIVKITSRVGDTIDITISVGDDAFLENISQIKLITNFAKKPMGFNNYFGNNYNDYRQVGLSVYEWYQTRDDIKYSYDETIYWNEPSTMIQQRTLTNHDYVGFLLFNEKELLVTYHMDINKVMDQTQVTAKIIDSSNKITNVVLPFTLEILPKLEEKSIEEKPIEEKPIEEEPIILKNNESQFNIKADKSTYENGNKVTITGQIEDFDPKKGQDLYFSIKSPENEIILLGHFAPKSDGSFSFSTFAMDSSWKSDGDYVFEVKFNSIQEKIFFFYDNSKVESIPLLEETIVEEPLLEETIVEEPLLEETIVEEPLLEETIVEAPVEQIEEIEEQSVNSTSNCGTGTELVNGICQVIQTEEKSSKGGGCLIATATYGSEMAVEVQQLRELRDNTLLNTESGTSFMNTFNDIYYTFSPTIADYERENPLFKEAVKLAITPMISSLSLMENANSESEVLSIGISVIALNLGMYLGVPAIVVIGIRKRF